MEILFEPKKKTEAKNKLSTKKNALESCLEGIMLRESYMV